MNPQTLTKVVIIGLGACAVGIVLYAAFRGAPSQPPAPGPALPATTQTPGTVVPPPLPPPPPPSPSGSTVPAATAADQRIATYCIEHAKQFLDLAFGSAPEEPQPHSTVTSILTQLTEGQLSPEGSFPKEQIYYLCRMFADRAPISEDLKKQVRDALEPLRKKIENATVRVVNRSEYTVFVGSYTMKPGSDIQVPVEIPGAWYPGCPASFPFRVGENGEEEQVLYQIRGERLELPPKPGRPAPVRWTRFLSGEDAGNYELIVCAAGGCGS